MGIIIKKTDFTGKYRINQNCFSDLEKYIDKYEMYYVNHLLGCDLAQLFVDDYNAGSGTPTEARFQNILNAFCEDDGLCIRVSEGMKEMLVGFLYFEFMKDAPFRSSQSGAVKNMVETSKPAGSNEFDIYTRYNLAVETFKSIQWYICENSSTYPEYNGQPKTYNHWSF